MVLAEVFVVGGFVHAGLAVGADGQGEGVGWAGHVVLCFYLLPISKLSFLLFKGEAVTLAVGLCLRQDCIQYKKFADSGFRWAIWK